MAKIKVKPFNIIGKNTEVGFYLKLIIFFCPIFENWISYPVWLWQNTEIWESLTHQMTIFSHVVVISYIIVNSISYSM